MAQIALSLMLLFAAGLFLRGALEAANTSKGFDPAGGIVTEMDFSLGKTDVVQAKRLMFAAIERARSLPGVRGGRDGHHAPLRKFHKLPPHHAGQ